MAKKKKTVRKLSVFRNAETGEIPVKDFLLSLKSRNEARLKLSFDKFPVYVRVLLNVGPMMAGTNYVRKIEGIKQDIWELRPGDARVFFVALVNETTETGETIENYVLLHGFIKSTQKTPPNEIRRAQDELRLLTDGLAVQVGVDDVTGLSNPDIESNLDKTGGDNGD